MQIKPSPMPWKVVSALDPKANILWIYSGQNLICGIQDSDQGRMDATFIARAVNAHDELLEIVKVLCDMAKKGMTPSFERLEDYRRVIAKAEGE